MTIKGFQTEIKMGELSDVDVTGSPGLSTGDALIFNTATQKFEHQPTPIFTGLDALPDVTITKSGSPLDVSEKQILSYDTNANLWINRKIPDAGLLACSTGLMTGGELQFGTLDGTGGGSPVGSPLTTTTTVTITAGSGVVVNNYTDPLSPTYTTVTWSEFTDETVTFLLSADRSFFAISAAGSLLQQNVEFTAEEHRDVIHIGTAGHANNTNIVAVRSNPHAAFDPNVRLGDLAEAIGAFNISGNVYIANAGGNLNINKGAGESYRLGNNFHTSKKSPDITEDAEDNSLSFNYSYRDNVAGDTFTLTSKTITIDTSNYDDGTGTPVPVPGTGDFQVQIIKHFPGGAGHRIEYGQFIYTSKIDAIAAIPDITHIHNPAFAEGIVRAYLVVQDGSTDLTILAEAEFIEAGRFGAAGAAGSSGGGVFTSSFESTALAITASSDHPAVHGLGVRPSGMQAFLRCNTAELGYAIGDEAEFMNDGTTNYKGLYANATTIGWYTGTNLSITNRTTGAEAQVTLASWDIILRAYT